MGIDFPFGEGNRVDMLEGTWRTHYLRRDLTSLQCHRGKVLLVFGRHGRGTELTVSPSRVLPIMEDASIDGACFQICLRVRLQSADPHVGRIFVTISYLGSEWEKEPPTSFVNKHLLATQMCRFVSGKSHMRSLS